MACRHIWSERPKKGAGAKAWDYFTVTYERAPLEVEYDSHTYFAKFQSGPRKHAYAYEIRYWRTPKL
jgi:hypothetical protein